MRHAGDSLAPGEHGSQERVALGEELGDEAAEGALGGGVAVDEVLEGGDVVGAGQELDDGGLAVAAMWLGLTISYEIPELPPSSCVIAVAAAIYALAFALAGDGPRWPDRDRTRKPQLD